MKKIILLFATLFIVIFQLAAQHLPFQGKLYQDGTPVSGMRNFEFEIESLDWTEAHGSIQVTKGLYALTLGNINNLPTNLFTKDQRSRMLKVMVEGALLDEVMLYAPLEIDGDPENELQALKMSGDTLHLTKGNFVLLNNKGSNISSTLSVGKPDTIIDKTSQTSGGADEMSNVVWQSFTPIKSGWISSIELHFNNVNNVNMNLKIGKGRGNVSSPNQFPVFAADFPAAIWLKHQTIELEQPVKVEAFQEYTFLLEAEEEFMVGKTDSDAYLEGISNFGSTSDLNFTVNYLITSGYTLNVTERGNVGIGVDEPQEKLEVAGRIKDKSGYVSPAGMVVPFAGPKANIPDGWLLCDGKMYDREEYNDLFNAIGAAWGDRESTADEPDPSKFKVPDLRGYFLRGVDPGTSRDPDSKIRHAIWGGNTGNSPDKVGSYQYDMFKKHNHQEQGMKYHTNTWSGGGKAEGGYTVWAQNKSTASVGGNETRSKNAYVHYIIKY